MPFWLGAGLWLATRFTVGAVGAVCLCGGWLLGYQYRDLVEWGRKCGRLLGWWARYRWRPLRAVARMYAELWRDVVHLLVTGELRPGR